MIVENNDKKIVQAETKSKKFILEGIFTEFDIENRNKRIYTAENFVPVMNSTLLAKKEKLGVVYGEFDHPDVFDVSGKNASHVIESLTYNKANNRVDGSICMLNTRHGKDARAIIEDGHPLFVSSRAAGVTDSYGRVELKELFTYDIVLDPGFASARVKPINESLGHSCDQNTYYRIYEMNDIDAQKLFTDNKNDKKTLMDITKMEQFLQTELAKHEHKVMEMIQKAQSSPAEVQSALEQIDLLKEELSNVNKFLEFLQPKMNYLIEQNSKLVEKNKQLEAEVNETIGYANSIASNMKKVVSNVTDMDDRLHLTEQFSQYVAEHTAANILFTKEAVNEQKSITEMLEYVAENVKNQKEFIEYVAEEAHTIGQFAEQVAEEADIIGQFAENTAKETNDAQGFLDYVANEKHNDEIWLSYVAEKVDGLTKYQTKIYETLKGNSSLNESIKTSGLIDPNDFLGINEELEMIKDLESETPVATATIPEIIPAADSTPADTAVDITANTTTDDTTTDDIATANTDTATAEVTADENTQSVESEMLNKLVNILTSDDTGIVIEILPNDVVKIQKSGNDEIVEVPSTDVKIISEIDNCDYLESVNMVLAAINKQKALENQAPHFFNFLNEQQIVEFKGLNKEDQANIIMEMDSREYFSADDVLKVISGYLKNKATSREEELLSSMPEDLKEAWTALDESVKKTYLNESVYFDTTTQLKAASFWNSRSFAKALKSPATTMINEAMKNTETNNTAEYEAAFLKAYNNLK